MLGSLEGRIAHEDRGGVLRGLARETRVNVLQVDDPQLVDPALLVAKELPRAADLEIALRQGEPVEGFAVLALDHRLQSLRLRRVVAHEDGERPLVAAPDSSPQLMEL